MSSGLPSATSRTAAAGEPGSLSQGKQSFQQNAGGLSVPAEQPLAGDTAATQIYGANAKKSNKRWKLTGILGPKNTPSKASVHSAEQIEALRSQLLVAEAKAEWAQLQYSKLLEELHEKDRLLRDREDLICRLKQQSNIQKNNNIQDGFLSGGESKAMQFRDQASSLLWRLVSLFYFLSTLGVGLVYYNIQIVQFLLKVFLFGPLRFFVSLLRSLFLGLLSSLNLFCAT